MSLAISFPAILTEIVAFMPRRKRPPAPDPVRERATRLHAEGCSNWGVLCFRVSMEMMKRPDGRFDMNRPPMSDAEWDHIARVSREVCDGHSADRTKAGDAR